MGKWQTRGAKLFCVAISLFVVFIVLKYAFGAILPFLLALAVALPLSSLAKKTHKRCGGSVRAWSSFYVVCFWSVLAVFFSALAKRLYFEAIELMDYFESNADMISESLRDTANKLLSLPSRLPFFKILLGKGENAIGENLSETLKNLITVISEGAGKLVAKIAVATPRVVVGVAVTVISSFYFCRDIGQIKCYLIRSFPETSRPKIKNILQNILSGVKSYAKAYSKLFLVTFVCTLTGLLILRRKYAFLIALFLAFFDLLPLFGAGIVLVPWGIVLIAEGALPIGIGLIILALSVSVIRQICEPRFIGRELGIHPLASLAAIYIGLRIFGFWGMVIAPIAILVLKQSRREMQTSAN